MNYKTTRWTRSFASVKAMMLVALMACAPLGLMAGVTGGHEWVDLGLPSGTLWATCNVGANSPEEFGDYFAWGETEPKDTYNRGTYKWMNVGQSSWSQINKYTFADDQTSGCWYDGNGNFIGDGLTELLPEDDAAAINWDDRWRMPTQAQQDELRENCTWEWTQLNGENGTMVTGPNGNTIFLPAAGYLRDADFYLAGSRGYYWSRSLDTDDSVAAYILYFHSGSVDWSNSARYFGRSVRPVLSENALSPPVQLVTSIMLSQSSLTLSSGNSQTLIASVLPSNATNKNVTWSSSNSSIAIVDQTGKVIAKAVGTCVITCSAVDGSGVKTECQMTVTSSITPDLGNHAWVDLGLPSGTLWATCNVGANSPEEYGDYFAWGETEPKDNYCTDTYTYTHPSGQGELDSEYDVATVYWGDRWQMPSVSQFRELINSEYTTIEWITRNGISGELITSKQNGESIFMPCAGYRSYSSVEGIGGFSWYWSKTISTKYGSTYIPIINILYFNSYCYNYILETSGESGLPVRPVNTQTGPPVQLVTSITLNQTSLTIHMGETQVLTATVLPSDASNKKVVWTSSDPDIASVDQTGMVTAVSVGICTITCSTTDRSGLKTECRLTVTRNPDPDTNNHEWVDLGLPSGTLWATCNVGANSPEERGDRFAWGETDPKSDYSWEAYKWCNGSYNTLTKYCSNSDYGYNGFTDNLTELLPEDDAATFNWGAEWRMPSPEQFAELRTSQYVTREWTTLNNVDGYMITSTSNGNSIFLPVANGYWSYRGTLTNSAYYLLLLSYGIVTDTDARKYGQNIRPVRIQTSSVQYVTNILLSETSLSLHPNETKTLTATVLPSNATKKEVMWSSSNSSIAIVDQTGKVTAVAAGMCTIICSATDGSGVTAECQVMIMPVKWAQKVILYMRSNHIYEYGVPELTDIKFDDQQMKLTVNKTNNQKDEYNVLQMDSIAFVDEGVEYDEHEYVDLGLPSGTLWATCNVGANSPEEYGDYFAWGETEPKDTYNRDTYFDSDYNKYNNDGGLTELLPEDDAATANWGGGWQMPSLDQITELINSEYTTTEWTTQSGVDGRKITSNSNGNSIFLPAAGYRYDTSLFSAGYDGYYWSRSLDTSYSSNAYNLYIGSGGIYGYYYYYRDRDQSVRPVRVQGE